MSNFQSELTDVYKHSFSEEHLFKELLIHLGEYSKWCVGKCDGVCSSLETTDLNSIWLVFTKIRGLFNYDKIQCKVMNVINFGKLPPLISIYISGVFATTETTLFLDAYCFSHCSG